MTRRLWTLGFLLLAVLTGPPLVLHIPLGHAPDEINHVLRADSLLHGVIIGHRGLQDGRLVEGALADVALTEVVALPPTPLKTSPQAMSPVRKWLATQVPWDTAPVFMEGGSVAGYMPLLYVPGAVAIGLCRAAGLSPFIAFTAVRCANFYCFLVLGAMALWVARRGTAIIFATLLLPMTLSLAASCSQDGLLIAIAACAVACITRAVDPAGQTQGRWLAAAACLLAVAAAAKPPYAPLALLLMLPWRPRPAYLLRRICLVATTILPALAWSILESRVALVTVKRMPAQAGPLWPGPRPAIFDGPDPMAQLQVLLSHKTLIAMLPLRAVVANAHDLLQQGVGVLDYVCLYLPGWLYLAWYIGLACALAAHMCATASAARLSPPDFLLGLSAILLSVITLGLALYLDWTPIGMPWIGGLQGRYFLPLVPALALCLPRFSRPSLAAALAVPSIAAACLSATTLPTIVTAFYPLAAR